MAHIISQLQRERLASSLRLIFIERFFAGDVIGRRLVGRLRHDKWIAGRIDGRILIARRRPRGIGLRLACARRAQRAKENLRGSKDDDRVEQALFRPRGRCISHFETPILMRMTATIDSRLASELDQIAPGPCSPVRMRITSSRADTKILPSPITPVRAPSMIASTTGSTSSSSTAILRKIFGRKSTTYSDPR